MADNPTTRDHAAKGAELTADVRRLHPSAIMPRSQRKAALLETALANILYEVTHLSPCEDDGSHKCKISAEAVRLAREALQAT